ncbi:hypothetical protein, partial [Bacillus subtilis]|uniref:hypothetical protein n=1 Tax=Bacillus subtilis TaxID=1423 RepID=UPI001BDB9752
GESCFFSCLFSLLSSCLLFKNRWFFRPFPRFYIRLPLAFLMLFPGFLETKNTRKTGELLQFSLVLFTVYV